MNRILCSTGALLGRANGRDFTLLADLEKRLECDGFELMMYEDWYEKAGAAAAFLKGLEKPCVTFHVEKRVGDLISRNAEGDTEKAAELFELNCKLAQEIGSEKLVLHLWSGLDSDKDMPHCIEMYAICRDIAQKYDILLTVENVVCNRNDPISDMHTVLKAYPDAVFTYDTKMAEFHGQLMDIALDENRPLWERVVHLHANDYKGGIKDWANLKTLHLGEGQADLEGFFDLVRERGYKGDITVESTSFGKTDGIIDVDKMNASLAKARELING
ncbi:MAG: sugar phosphate isomerase/epimerase [Oscillospiraceae bacterium]|nr:sugar phosphate isomerase/epimerase [Oscillospiraceae bacterium]